MSPSPTIAEINDAFRQRLDGGRLVITKGISDLPLMAQADIVHRVRTHETFTEDNDPYGEHDFGVIDHAVAGKVFWKIDYYDPTLQQGSEDPLDAEKTCRVLTILLAEEW